MRLYEFTEDNVRFVTSSQSDFERGFSVEMYVNGKHVGSYKHYVDEDGVQSSIDISPKFQGKGYGKLLTLKAIYVATEENDLGFERDVRGETKVQNQVYNSLEKDGLITSGLMNVTLTSKGLDLLQEL